MAAISYIYSIVTMPTQILVNTVVSVSMPHWAKLTGNRGEFADSLGRALGLLLLAVVPLALCLHFAASPISSILLGSSAFVQSKRDEIAALLGSFALASIGFALKDTLAAALISQRKPAHALAGGFFSLLVAWAVRTSLPGDLGLRAAAIATTIGLFTAAGVAMWSVANREWLGNLWARVRIAIVPAFPAIAAGNVTTTPEASATVAVLVYGLFVLGSMRCWDWTPANTRHIEG
ncbi:hypothetical protein F183_A27690 [Bryobacterales bacterium F-183]|nr:hypothetical protein F183_A27690 [Bryobacterales bacterium F-183]